MPVEEEILQSKFEIKKGKFERKMNTEKVNKVQSITANSRRNV
jgi:hypothetical protein